MFKDKNQILVSIKILSEDQILVSIKILSEDNGGWGFEIDLLVAEKTKRQLSDGWMLWALEAKNYHHQIRKDSIEVFYNMTRKITPYLLFNSKNGNFTEEVRSYAKTHGIILGEGTVLTFPNRF